MMCRRNQEQNTEENMPLVSYISIPLVSSTGQVISYKRIELSELHAMGQEKLDTSRVYRMLMHIGRALRLSDTQTEPANK
jgi:hypothetical protein